MHPTSSPMQAVDAIVAAARAKAGFAARLLRRLDPFRDDPRIACVGDLCAVLEGPHLFRDDTLQALETLAERVADKLVAASAQGRPDPQREALDTLHAALVETVETARALDALLMGDPETSAGPAR